MNHTSGYNLESSCPFFFFDTKGIPAHRRERIQAAVEAGGKHMRENYAAWITTTGPFRGVVRVRITGPQGFERTVQCTRSGGVVDALAGLVVILGRFGAG